MALGGCGKVRNSNKCGNMRSQDCRALAVGGINSSEMALKMEETDFGNIDYQDYLDDIHRAQDKYMRNAITDRNCEQPFAGDENDGNFRDAGKLNLRYNETRGNTDYLPDHSEMMIGQDMGDPGITNGAFGSATETSLDMTMGKFKKFAAQRTDNVRHEFGNDTDWQIWEQAWADPDISYAKKDMQRWAGANLNIWQWPSFENFQVPYDEVQYDSSKATKERVETAKLYLNDKDNVYDKMGKVSRNKVGFNYHIHPYTIASADMGDHEGGRKTGTGDRINDPFRTRNQANKEGMVANIDSNMSKQFKGTLAYAMKSAIKDQNCYRDIWVILLILLLLKVDINLNMHLIYQKY